eukprot:g3548.t1
MVLFGISASSGQPAAGFFLFIRCHHILFMEAPKPSKRCRRDGIRDQRISTILPIQNWKGSGGDVVMHGRKRGEKDPINAERLAKYAKLRKIALAKHRTKEYTEETKVLTGKLIGLNPDFYTLWNFRRDILLHLRAKDPAGPASWGPESAIAAEELQLTRAALKQNPKSYCAWFHREWSLRERLCTPEQELQLCEMYLKVDSRNFHCWNYRRFVVSYGKMSLQHEFNYTTEKIQDNFSNYSAWHYRSVLIPRILAEKRQQRAEARRIGNLPLCPSIE